MTGGTANQTEAGSRRGASRRSRTEPFKARIPHHDAHFPLRVSHIAPLLPQFGYLHQHPEYEIAVIPRDHGAYMIQDIEIPIAPGDIFIVNANDIHQPIIPEPKNGGALVTYFRASLFPDPEECAQWTEPFIYAGEFGFNRLGPDPELETLLRQLHEAAKPEAAHWQIASRGLITHILSIIALRFAAHCAATGAAPRIAKAHRFAPVIAHINARLHSPIEANDLYRLAGLSHSQFSEAFKAAFGASVTRYIQTQRLKRARRLLRSTDLSITEIAFACGFGASSVFNTAFRRDAGVTPTQYRALSQRP